MNFVDLIIKKRDGCTLNKDEINFFIKSVTDDTVPDYQISSMLMAIFLKGLSNEETADLTMAMVNSGVTLDLSEIDSLKVDKHSTGGIADTTTLILAPLVASCGLSVIKMSGRGLGFTGGTIDKLESIGLDTDISQTEAIHYVKQSNIVLMSQTADLAPADKKLYALRDVTGTVDSLPLIASSIMSKKIAAGADAIVLDVKCGSGAFMPDYDSAKALAQAMVTIGKHVGRKVVAIITSMDQPLGMNIGNALEVEEAIEVLKGNITGDLLDVSLELGAYMLVLGEKAAGVEKAKDMLLNNIQNGKGYKKFLELVAQQSNTRESKVIIPKANASLPVKAKKDGYIYKIQASELGKASVMTGAGRITKDDKLDYSAGIVMKVRIGDYIKKDDTIAILYASTVDTCKIAARILEDAIEINSISPLKAKLILDIIK